MPLALIVDTIESVPETLRGEYVEKDGKFHLNVEGMPDVGGLKSALESERAARKALDTEIKSWKKLGKTPTEIAELTEAAETAAAEAAKKAGNFDGILAQHKTKWDGERATLVGERDGALNVARSAVVDAGIVGGKNVVLSEFDPSDNRQRRSILRLGKCRLDLAPAQKIFKRLDQRQALERGGH